VTDQRGIVVCFSNNPQSGVQVKPFAVHSEDHDGLDRFVDDAEPMWGPRTEFYGLTGCYGEVKLAKDQAQPSRLVTQRAQPMKLPMSSRT
jgi:hypothetical protein